MLKSSETRIEEAANRPPPFGADLRKASAKILRCRLKISAKIEMANGSITPSSIICTLKHSNHTEETEHTANDAPEVTYTLIAYTDQPGGLILFKENISGLGTHEALLPPQFGKITVRLFSSIVGLDGKSREERIAGRKKADRNCIKSHISRIARRQAGT